MYNFGIDSKIMNIYLDYKNVLTIFVHKKV